MTAPLSPEEAAVVARFDAAEAAPESLRERVALALYEHEWRGFGYCFDSQHNDMREYWLTAADAAISVMRGES